MQLTINEFFGLEISAQDSLLDNIFGPIDSIVYCADGFSDQPAYEVFSERLYTEREDLFETGDRQSCARIAQILMFFNVGRFIFWWDLDDAYAFRQVFPWGCFNRHGTWNALPTAYENNSGEDDDFDIFVENSVLESPTKILANQWTWGYPGIRVLDAILGDDDIKSTEFAKISQVYNQRTYTTIAMDNIENALVAEWIQEIPSSRYRVQIMTDILSQKRLRDTNGIFKGMHFMFLLDMHYTRASPSLFDCTLLKMARVRRSKWSRRNHGALTYPDFQKDLWNVLLLEKHVRPLQIDLIMDLVIEYLFGAHLDELEGEFKEKTRQVDRLTMLSSQEQFKFCFEQSVVLIEENPHIHRPGIRIPLAVALDRSLGLSGPPGFDVHFHAWIRLNIMTWPGVRDASAELRHLGPPDIQGELVYSWAVRNKVSWWGLYTGSVVVPRSVAALLK